MFRVYDCHQNIIKVHFVVCQGFTTAAKTINFQVNAQTLYRQSTDISDKYKSTQTAHRHLRQIQNELNTIGLTYFGHICRKRMRINATKALTLSGLPCLLQQLIGLFQFVVA